MKLTKKQAKQLQALGRMKDEDIDFSDIPELTGNEKFIVGKFYRPVKEPLRNKRGAKMRKFFWIIWILDTLALAWLFGYILLYGSTPDRTALAGNLGAIWGGLAGVGGWSLFTAKRKAKKEKEKAAVAN